MQHALKRVLTIVGNITTHSFSEEGNRIDTIATLMSYLPPGLYDYAFECIDAIPDLSFQALPLLRLIPTLPPDLQLEAQRKCLASIRVIPELWRAGSYVSLAPYLPPSLAVEAWQDVRAMTKAKYRAEASSVLIPHLAEDMSEQVLRETIDDIFAVEKLKDRAKPLANLAPYLSEEGLWDAVDAVFDRENFVYGGFEYKVKEMLANLMPYLTPYPSLLNLALSRVHSIDVNWKRNEVLRLLLPYLPTHLQQQVKAEIPPEPVEASPQMPTTEELAALVEEIKDKQQRQEKLWQIANKVNSAITLSNTIPHPLTSVELGDLFTSILQDLATRSRRDFLSGLSSHIPLIRALDGQGITQSVAMSTVEVIEWWP